MVGGKMGSVYDCIVVGAGITGLSTAFNLASRGNKKVLLLEQFHLPHSRGSSFGQTRITRLAYSKPEYIRLVLEAHRKWRLLEEQSGLHLYRRTGLVVLGSKTSPKFLADRSALESSGVPHRLLHSSDLTAWSHLFQAPADYCGVWEPDGGILFATRCLRAYLESYLRAGGELREGVQVVDIQPGAVMQLRSRTGQIILGRSVVLALGPWAPRFLSDKLGLSLPIQADRTLCCYWRVTGGNKDAYSADEGSPAVLIRELEGDYFFKSTVDYPGLLYFGIHLGEKGDPDCPEKTKIGTYLEKCRRLGAKLRLNIDLSEPAIVEHCFYTESEDEDYILDRHPKYQNLIIGTGFSGHGFKLAPVVGEILTSLACDETPPYPVEMFSIRRFRRLSKL